MAEEQERNSSRGLRKLLGEFDYDDWALASQAKLGTKGLWDVVTGPRPARREIAISADERERERKRRIAPDPRAQEGALRRLVQGRCEKQLCRSG